MAQITAQADLSKDRQQIIDFWRNNAPKWPKDKYKWFYESNPAGTANCWLALSKDENEIIGTVVLFPRNIYVNGIKNKSSIVGDLFFKKEHRNFFSAFALEKQVLSAVKEGTVDFIYGYPNMQAEQLMKRSGYKIIGTSARYNKIIKTYGFINSKLKNKFVSRIFSTIFDPILFFFSRETYRAASANKNTSFQIIAIFDERFDRLWEKSIQHYPIIGERNSKFLNWRFNRCPYYNYKIFTLCNKTTDEVYGYIVYKIENKKLVIADLLLEDIDKYGDNLLVLFLKYARTLNIEAIDFTFLGPDSLKKILKNYTFLNRPDNRSILVYADENSNQADFIFDSESWYFMECDVD